MLTETGPVFRHASIARLRPDLQAIARAMPHDRVAAVLPLLAEMCGWLDRARNGRT
jgi:hypothetical protein